MQMPKTPPQGDGELWQRLASDPERAGRVLGEPPTVGRKYYHWDKLRHLDPPEGLSHREWWLGIKIQRRGLYKSVELKDKASQAFQYAMVDPIPEQLHKIDLGAGGFIQMPEQVTNPETRDQYYVNSLIEEAITSSQLEGATTTRPVAKELIRTGRTPRDRSEQMIVNNYLTMQRIARLKREPLSPQTVFDLHNLVTAKTLDDPTAAGRLRHADERVVVGDELGEVFHDPPPAEQLPQRLESMCEFANAQEPFVHPVVRAIILHFWLAYDHPFVDGNGRTARALFYWSMLRQGYWLCEFISISHIILKAPVKYGRAFLYTETDDNDLTYFIIYHLDVIERAVHDLHAYIRHRTLALQQVEAELRGMAVLNHRQRALMAHALRHPGHIYTVESHQRSHNIVNQTARTDLAALADKGLLVKRKKGRMFQFRPASDLESRLSDLR